MQKVKYGVWFHGSKNENEGICYDGRHPYIVDNRSLALEYKKYLQSGVSSQEEHLFSVCEIHISNNLIKE